MRCRDISAGTSTCTGPGKPLLNGSGSYFPRNSGAGFGVELGVIHPDHGNCGITATLGADLTVRAANVWHRSDGLGIGFTGAD